MGPEGALVSPFVLLTLLPPISKALLVNCHTTPEAAVVGQPWNITARRKTLAAFTAQGKVPSRPLVSHLAAGGKAEALTSEGATSRAQAASLGAHTGTTGITHSSSLETECGAGAAVGRLV